MKYMDKEGILREMSDSQDRFFRFIYAHRFTRLLLAPLVRPGFSRFAGRLMDSRPSTVLIRRFIKKNRIDMSQFEARKFRSFNDFFTRAVLPEKRPVPSDPSCLFSPCDAFLSVFPVSDELEFTVKNTRYTLPEFLKSEEEARDFAG